MGSGNNRVGIIWSTCQYSEHTQTQHIPSTFVAVWRNSTFCSWYEIFGHPHMPTSEPNPGLTVDADEMVDAYEMRNTSRSTPAFLNYTSPEPAPRWVWVSSGINPQDKRSNNMKKIYCCPVRWLQNIHANVEWKPVDDACQCSRTNTNECKPGDGPRISKRPRHEHASVLLCFRLYSGILSRKYRSEIQIDGSTTIKFFIVMSFPGISQQYP